jgi:predicted RNA binding protein YcfA (HicA-like mRNA interferase family)
MKSDDLIRELKKAGWVEVRVAGSHQYLQAPSRFGTHHCSASEEASR